MRDFCHWTEKNCSGIMWRRADAVSAIAERQPERSRRLWKVSCLRSAMLGSVWRFCREKRKLKEDLERYEGEFEENSRRDGYYWNEYRDRKRIRRIRELMEVFDGKQEETL